MISHNNPQAASGLASRLVIGTFVATFFCVVLLEIFNARFQNQELVAFWIEFLRDDNISAWLTLIVIGLGVPFSFLLAKWDLPALAKRLNQQTTVIYIGSFIFFCCLMTIMAFRHPFVADEYLAIFASKTFATGHLKSQVPLDLIDMMFPHYVVGDMVVISRATGQSMSAYSPGNSLLMVPFVFFQLEWLFNPFITAVSLWVLYRVSQQLVGEKGGIHALVFALASPVIALNAATFFSMPTHFLANLLFCWAFIQNKRWLTFLAGVIGSYALILHNPAPHLTFAIPWVLWTCRYRPKQLPYLLAGYSLIFLPMSAFWTTQLQTFDAGRFIVQKAAQSSSESSRFAEIVSRLVYTFRLPGNDILQLRLAGFIKLIVWASPGLVVLAWLGWRSSANDRKQDSTPNENHTYLWLLGASLITNFLFYFLVRFDQGHGYGFRYMHQTWFALPILGAYAISKIPLSARAFRVPVKAYLFTLALLSVSLLLPLRVLQGQIIMRNVLAEGPLKSPEPVGIVFYNETNGAPRDSLVQNDPFLRNSVWRFGSRGAAKNEAIARKYLVNPKLVSSEKWGEMWSGESFNPFARS